MSGCRDGDLRTFVSGEFDVISTMGNICNGSHGGFCPPGLIAGNATQVLDIVQLIDVTIKELIVLIRNPPTRSISYSTSNRYLHISFQTCCINVSLSLQSALDNKSYNWRRCWLCWAGRLGSCTVKKTMWPTFCSAATSSRPKLSTARSSTSAARSPSAQTGRTIVRTSTRGFHISN